MDPLFDSKASPYDDEELHDEHGLHALWKHVEDNWANVAAHAALLDASNERKALPSIAKLYRIKLESPDEAITQVARAQLDKIVALAFAQLESTHQKPRSSKGPITALALLVSLILMGSCIFALCR